MINDLKCIDGVLHKLTPIGLAWVPVPDQVRKPDAVRLSAEGEQFIYYGGPYANAARDAINSLVGKMTVAATIDELEASNRIRGENVKVLQAQAKELCDKVDYWKRIAANRKERNNALAEMLRAERETVRLLRYALEKMIGLAKCFIPAGRTNSIVDNAIKVLQDTK